MADLDPHLQAPARLKLVTMLTAVSEAEFALVRDRLGVSDSVLSKHLSALGDAQSSSVVSVRSVDPERLRPLLARLATLLAESDGEAFALLSAEEATLKPALGTGFIAVEKALHDLDFESALEKLKATADQHNIAL